MFLLHEMYSTGKPKNVSGKYQYGQVVHAQKRAEKDYGGKLFWEMDNENWIGKDKAGKIWYHIQYTMSNPMKKNPAKGSVDYHRRVDFRALDVFVHAVKSATRDEIRGAVKTASEMSKDLAVNSNERPIWKRLASLLRAQLKGYAKNPKDKGFIIEDKSPRSCAYMHKQIKGFMEHGRPGAIYVCGGCQKEFKVPAKKARKKNPEIEIRELILFAENEEPLSNQFYSILKNLEKKAAKGIYDPVLAAKLWKYWIDEAVKHYNRVVLGGGYSLKQSVFTVQDRKDAAIEVERQWRDDVKRGDNPIKKKVSRKKRAKKNPTTHYNVFKCKGNDLRWLKGFALDKPRWTLTRGDAAKYRYEHEARGIAKYAYARGWKVGAAEKGSRVADIIKMCKPGKV